MRRKNIKKEIINPLWLTISEASKVCGISNKTVRRSIKNLSVDFKVIDDRYFVELLSVVIFLKTNVKLSNKYYEIGLGQYLEKLKELEEK